MIPGERFKGWIDSLAVAWKGRLGGWMADWVSWGLDLFFRVLATSFAPKLRPMLDRLEATGEIPEELKPLLNELRAPTGEAGAILGSVLGFSVIGGAMGKVTDALFIPLAYGMNKWRHNLLLEPSQLIYLRLRGFISEEQLTTWLQYLGYADVSIKGLKELANIIPPLADMVRFADFSAFDPEVIEKWRAFYDAPGWITDPMSLAGISNEPPRDWANKYWFSHWIQPGRYELGEIYRRGLLGKPLVGQEEIGLPGGEGEAEKAIKLAYRTMGYSAYWQDHLLQLVRAIPTRVDVRRWWDMRTIDEAELRSIYRRQGYFGKDLENYVLWTKVYVAFPDLVARYKNGWINEETVLSEIIALGMPAERAKILFETKFKKGGEERVAAERDLTATDIIAGVKKGIITWGEGIELLMDLGWDEDEAGFKLAVKIETEGGSPANKAEFKRLTQLWRASQGLPTRMTPEEIKAAEKRLAEEYPRKRKLTEAELKVKVDTLRRRRRTRSITRDQEIVGLLELGLTVELSEAYAENDDLRIRKGE